jgi:hypothetical protein
MPYKDPITNQYGCTIDGMLKKSDWGTLVPKINVENGIKLGFLME